MSFTTALFWFFILIGVVIYYVLPSKVRWIWLLVLSYLYYFSFNVKNSLFMVAASLVIYLAALAMEYIQDKSDVYLKEHKAEIDREQKKKLKNSVKHKKRIILVIAMIINFGVLAVLKYGGFITGNITAVLNKIGIDKTVYALSNYVMPLGLSFFTFQSISYVRGNTEQKRILSEYVFLYHFSHRLCRDQLEDLISCRKRFLQEVHLIFRMYSLEFREYSGVCSRRWFLQTELEYSLI